MEGQKKTAEKAGRKQVKERWSGDPGEDPLLKVRCFGALVWVSMFIMLNDGAGLMDKKYCSNATGIVDNI